MDGIIYEINRFSKMFKKSEQNELSNKMLH